jgi:hypothetical protein
VTIRRPDSSPALPSARSNHSAKLAALLAYTSLALTTPCSAQNKLGFVPFVGIYLPTSAVWSVSGTCLGGVGSCGTYPVTQGSGLVYGIRLIVPASSRADFEVSFAYVPTTQVTWPSVPNGLDFNVSTSADAHATIGNAGVRLNFRPFPSSASVTLMGGASIVSRGGPAYEDERLQPPRSDCGIHLGVGARFPVSSRFTLHTDLEDVVYAFGSGASPQNAITLSLGLGAGLPVGKRAKL